MSSIRSVITGTGKYLPENPRPNAYFEDASFFNPDGTAFPADNKVIIKKFYAITGIKERKVLKEDLFTSDMGAIASENAIRSAGIDRESIDQIIVAHNFGDVASSVKIPDMMPSIASKIKNKLAIHNENCVAYDIIFGCPGWVQAMIQADVYIKSGYAKNCLVVGTESLARITDEHDRDSMIFSDGAGAVILSAQENSEQVGVLHHAAVTHAIEELDYLNMGMSYHNPVEDRKYIKMNGRKIYNYALSNVPKAIKSCIEKSGLGIEDIDKIFIHQANEKMDMAIGERLYALYGKESMPEDKMPMNIRTTGNSSVATVPTLLDMVLRNELPPHKVESGNVIVMASVGAGMNINAITYRVP